MSSSDNLFAEALKAKSVDTAPATSEAAPVVVPVPDEGETPVTQVSELDMLKNRARVMGIRFSNNIGVDALKLRIQAKLDGEADTDDDEDESNQPAAVVAPTAAVVTNAGGAAGNTAPVAVAPAPVSRAMSLRQIQYAEQMKLVRLRITNLNPAKKDLPGEIFTVANRVLGTVRKFIPYGEASDNGYHVPYWIYQQMKEREFQQIKVGKDSRGREKIDVRDVREFALEILPPLTELELSRLAASQAAKAGND